MYHFIVYEQGGKDLSGKEIFASSRANAVVAAKNTGINDPVVYLNISLPSIIVRHDLRHGILSLALPSSSHEAISYLRHQFGFRQRSRPIWQSDDDAPISVSALWSPEREDALRADLGLHIQEYDGLTDDDDAPTRVGQEYFAALATNEVELRGVPNGREVWKKLRGLRVERSGWLKRKGRGRMGPEAAALADRWIASLTYRMAFYSALMELSDNNLSAMASRLRRGVEVRVGGEWFPVLRVNEFTARVGPVDEQGGQLIGLDKIDEIRGEGTMPGAVNHQGTPVQVGDYVRHKGVWYPVKGVGPYTVVLATKRGSKRINRKDILVRPAA